MATKLSLRSAASPDTAEAAPRRHLVAGYFATENGAQNLLFDSLPSAWRRGRFGGMRTR